MTTKFYLLNSAAGVAGTQPASNAELSSSAPGAGTTVALSNKNLSSTPGVTQSTVAKTTLANTAAQGVPIGRWLSGKLAAQTIASQNIIVQMGFSNSNANSNFKWSPVIAIWRPSDGSLVGTLRDLNNTSLAAGTSEANSTVQSTTSSSLAILDGDCIALEIWRTTDVQSMGTAYTNTLFFAGTVEGSATDNRAFISFVNDVPEFVEPAPSGASADEQRTRRIRANLVR